MRTIRLDQLVDGAGAEVLVRFNPDGDLTSASFDLGALPRVERLLRGRPAVDVPTMIEHLCGICPDAHHLAGVQALEVLLGAATITPTAQAVRRLLHHAAVLQTHAQRLVDVDADRAFRLRSFARQVVSATSGPGHFPRCAVPGGVLATVSVADQCRLAGETDAAIEHAMDLVRQVERMERGRPRPAYDGHDVALVDDAGGLDLYGRQLRAVAADGTAVIDGACAQDWPELVAESRPGATASRPFLRAVGAERGSYRVGAVAQLRAPTHLSSPNAELARHRWAAAGGGSRWARAVVALHAAETVQALLTEPNLVAGPVLHSITTPDSPAGVQVASGWVDGARGLLVHTYRVDDSGELVDATITTPTAQNEGWLGDLLAVAAKEHAIFAEREAGHPPHGMATAMEAAVREADPCLPCSSMPEGQMRLNLTMIDYQGNIIVRWQLDEHARRTDLRAAPAAQPRAG